MDGNRRFAKSRSLHRARGHEHGADKLVEVLEWCLALGVEALSVYAFSTDNLKRDEEEVAGLFALAERRLLELAASGVIREKRVRVRVLGEVFSENNANAANAKNAIPRGPARRRRAGHGEHVAPRGPCVERLLRVHGQRGYRAGGGRARRRRARRRSRAKRRHRRPAGAMLLEGAAFDAAKGVMSCSRNAAHLLNVKRTEHDRDRVVRRTALDDVARRLRRVALGRRRSPHGRRRRRRRRRFSFGIVRNRSLVNPSTARAPGGPADPHVRRDSSQRLHPVGSLEARRALLPGGALVGSRLLHGHVPRGGDHQVSARPRARGAAAV